MADLPIFFRNLGEIVAMISVKDIYRSSWARERESALRLFRRIPSKILDRQPRRDVQSPGNIAWKMVQAFRDLEAPLGLNFQLPPKDAPVPTSLKAIYRYYKKAADALLLLLEQQWSEQDVKKVVQPDGKPGTQGKTLSMFISRQSLLLAQLSGIVLLLNPSANGL